MRRQTITGSFVATAIKSRRLLISRSFMFFVSWKRQTPHPLPANCSKFQNRKKIGLLLNFQSDFIDFIVNLTLSIDIGIQSLSATLPHPQLLFSVREACTRRFRFFLVFFKQGLTPHHPPYLGNELKQIIWICGYMLPLVPTFSIKIMWLWQFAIESLLILLQGSNASQAPVQCFRRK